MIQSILTAVSLAGSVVAAADSPDSVESGQVASRPELIYATESPNGCAILRFNVELAESIKVASVPDCSGRFHLSRGSESLYYVLNQDIYYVELSGGNSEIQKLSLPSDDFESYRASLDQPLSEVKLPAPDTDRLTPFWVGSLADGRIAVAMSVSLMADDYIALLIVRDTTRWVVADQRHCGSWEWPCIFPSFENEQSKWHEIVHDGDVWVVSQDDNEYLASAKLINIPDEYDNTFAERDLRFEVGRSLVNVKSRGEYSAHGMGIYTYKIRIEFDGTDGRTFDFEQCDITFFGKYFLVHPCGGPVSGQVFDMESGKVVVNSISHAAWLYD